MDKQMSLLVKFAGIDKLTGAMRGIGATAKRTGKDIADTRREIDRLQKVQARVAAFKDLEQKLRADSNALADVRAKIEAAEGSTKRLEKQEARLAASVERHGVELQSLSGRLTAAGVNVEDLARHEDRLGLKLYDANKRLVTQRQELERLGRQQQRIAKAEALGGRMQSGGATAVGVGLAAGVPAVAAGRKAIGFEESMADVRKVVDFANAGEFQKMNRDILDLSRHLPIAGAGIAQIVAAGGQANIPRKELLLFARDAGTMAIAFDTGADAAGDMMAKWRSAFGIGRTEVLKLADQVNYLGNSTAADNSLIADIVTRVGALGEVAGLNSGQVAAMAATLGSVGVESEVAATGIKNTMLALTKGEAATKSQKAAFDALGLSATDVAKRMQQDAAGTIIDVLQKIRALPKELQAGQMTELFGSESISAIAPMLTQLDALKANLTNVGNASKYAGSMQAEFDTRAGTTANKLQLYRNRMERLQIILGERLLPTVIRFAEWGGALADRIAAWSDRNPALSNGLMLLVSAFSALAVIGGTLSIVLGTALPYATKAFMLLGRPIMWIVRLAGIAIAAIAAFVGLPAWLVGAIAVALGAAAVLIYSNWDRIKQLFVDGVRWFVGLHVRFFEAGANLVRGIISGIGSMLGALKEKVLAIGRNTVEWFKGALGIKSPSRVFMGLGGYLTQGLALGVDRGGAEPIARMKRLAGQMTAAIAVGSATPAAAGPASPSAAGATRHYHFHIQQLPGQSPQDLAQAIRDELEKIDRQEKAEARSSYDDD